MAQLTYGYKTDRGVAGQIYDISKHVVDTRRNEEDDLKMHFGVGVVKGTSVGTQIKLPTSASVAGDFEGIVVNGGTTELTMANELNIKKDVALSVMHEGRIYVKVTDASAPAYGAKAYLVKSGADAGKFTSVADGAIDVGAKFLTAKENGLAVVEI